MSRAEQVCPFSNVSDHAMQMGRSVGSVANSPISSGRPSQARDSRMSAAEMTYQCVLSSQADGTFVRCSDRALVTYLTLKQERYIAVDARVAQGQALR